jgi:hypothetical protein
VYSAKKAARRLVLYVTSVSEEGALLPSWRYISSVLILLYMCVSSYYYVCVCPHNYICVLILLYMCPHTTIYVSSYYYIRVLYYYILHRKVVLFREGMMYTACTIYSKRAYFYARIELCNLLRVESSTYTIYSKRAYL